MLADVQIVIKHGRTGCKYIIYQQIAPLSGGEGFIASFAVFSLFCSNSYHSSSLFIIQHHAVEISGDLKASSYHLDIQSCIQTL